MPKSTRTRVHATLLALTLWAGAAAAGPAPGLKLHIPSPDWRDQILYFVVTDRFDDGNPANNDQGVGEFNPQSNAHYNGGDLAGLTRRLDYIRGLGVTGVWLTPPVANQWWDNTAHYSGYHGYWAQHFAQVDAHLGTLADYRQLSHQLHSAGMTLVQDIVVNHTGNFFAYGPNWSPQDPARGYVANVGSMPLKAPSQSPFDLNDPRRAADRQAHIYHWRPDVADYANPQQLLDWQMSGLDDLNTENPRVRRALRQSYGHWLRAVGVDGFRVDTALYVPPLFFDDFLHAKDKRAPGIEVVARQTGRRSFYSFGEGFAIDQPMAQTESQKIERYVVGPQGQPLMRGMLNFPLYGSLGDVMARGAPTAQLADRIHRMMKVHSAPHLMATFVDNHDVDRFLAGGTEAGLQQALLALMTLPGVPVIYYGTEQGFTEQRGAMFAAGFASGGRDRFDAQAPLYQAIARLTALRRAHKVLSRGRPTVLQSNAQGPGVLAWRMDWRGPRGPEAALVVLNTSANIALLQGVPTGLPEGRTLQPWLSLQADATPLRTGQGGLLSAELPPLSGQVWQLPVVYPATAQRTAALARARALTMDAPQPLVPGQTIQVTGQAPGGTALKLVVNGDVTQATAVDTPASGRWQATVAIGHLPESPTPHQVVAWSPALQAASLAQPFQFERPWALLADVDDPAGDDRGPSGRYVYPTDAGWGERHQADLRHARVWRAGAALKIELSTAHISHGWNPANGFDRVAFTLFFSQAGRSDGERELPLQQARLPGDLKWQHRLRLHGWSNALFSAEGAGANAEGTALTVGARLETNAQRGTVTVTLPAGALGPEAALQGMKIYITTWDYDGGYRALGPAPGGHSFGGGQPGDPKVMDDLLVTLP